MFGPYAAYWLALGLLLFVGALIPVVIDYLREDENDPFGRITQAITMAKPLTDKQRRRAWIVFPALFVMVFGLFIAVLSMGRLFIDAQLRGGLF